MYTEDGRAVVHATLCKLTERVGSGNKLDCDKLLKGLKLSGARTVQVDGQRYTYVSLEDLIAAIDDAVIDSNVWDNNPLAKTETGVTNND